MRTGVALCSLETLRLRQKQKIWTISFINRKAFWIPSPLPATKGIYKFLNFLLGALRPSGAGFLSKNTWPIFFSTETFVLFDATKSVAAYWILSKRYCSVTALLFRYCSAYWRTEYCDDAPDLVLANFMKHISLNHPSVISMENRRQPEIKLIFKKMLQFMDRHFKVIADHNLADIFSLIGRTIE